MARSYSVPSYSTFSVDRFKGVDLSVPEDQVKPYRAARSQNMIPGAMGEIKKRPGVQHKEELGFLDPVQGDYVLRKIGRDYTLYSDRGEDGYTTKGLYYKDHLIAMVYYEPTVISYGNGWVVFVSNHDDEENFLEEKWKDNFKNWRIGGKTFGAEYEFFSAVILLNVEGPVRVYTDQGYCCVMNEGGVWSADVISPDDPLLTVPVITKGADPASGAAAFQQVNLLSPWVTESYCCTADQTSVFYLNSRVSDITDTGIRWSDKATLERYFKVEVLAAIEIEDTGANEKATITRWVRRPITANGTNQDGFRPSANRIYLDPAGNGEQPFFENGMKYDVELGTGNDGWIGKSPIDGEDNVRITHWRAGFGEAFRKLCLAACGTVFGVGGYKDRIFVGGSRGGWGYKDRIYYSELEDPFYIGDQNYLKLEDGCSVMALDGTSNVLAAITDRGIYMVSGQAQSNVEDVMQVHDALFTVSGKVLAPAPLYYGGTAILGGEIVYLSKDGVIAIAYKEHFDERFAEHRSALIDAQMLKDGPLQLLSLGRFLMIRCKNGVWWLLDENQPNAEGNKPYSSHQYEGWRLTGMEADCAWVEGGELRIGYGNRVYEWKDGNDPGDYVDKYYHNSDEAHVKNIEAFWETPWIYGGSFHLDKNFIKMGLLLGECAGEKGASIVPIDSAVRVEVRKNEEDEWKILWDYDGTLCTFDYGRIDYRLFTYSGKPGCPDKEGKIKIKKAQRVKFRFSNEFANQGLILRRFCLNYVQEG